MTPELESLRATLDQLDDGIVAALAERQRLVDTVADRKLTQSGGLQDPRREHEIMTRLTKRATANNLDAQYVTRLFREILSHSVRRQQEHLLDTQAPQQRTATTLAVGFQGIEGAYSHSAATQHFAVRDVQARYQGFDSFRELLEAVGDGGLDYAVLPIENTTAGSINEAYDLLARMNLALVGEEVVKVEHCLLALEPTPVNLIRRIHSHPQALQQCSSFLSSLADCEAHAYADTALAARRLQDERDASAAAIASEEAARLYGLAILKRDIADQQENYTRFVVVARDSARYDPRIPCKTSIIFTTRHEQGALAACLNILADHRLNLSKLESRPRPNTPWEYLFYADFYGNVAEQRAAEALRQLAARTNFLKVLGSYPARVPNGPKATEPCPAEAAAIAEEDAKPQPVAGPSPTVLATLDKKPYKLVSRVNRPDDTLVHVGDVTIGGDRPVIIAGPCSVESREQVMASAKCVRDHGGHILRGGCFKPRTSPYDFQGLGYEGLDLLEQAGRSCGLPIITEVLHPTDVAAVARQADIIQIGARNMQNFALLKEVGQVDRPVLLKRGMMASIDEWLAAAEYILAQGNQQVILCERGIRTFETATRSTLDLSAVPVVRERTHLPIIVDPSHAAGTWRWVANLATAALACGAHGVMIEIHPDPENALSDGPQSLNFERFAELVKNLRRVRHADRST
jgi:chorismate mutase/prephenate dehydratase